MSRYCTATEVRARRAHLCWACGVAITPGQTYQRQAWVGDGSAYTLKLCLPCRDATPQVAAWSYGYELAPETYAEWAEETAVHTAGVEQQQALDYLARRADSAPWDGSDGLTASPEAGYSLTDTDPEQLRKDRP